jgi:transposase
MVYVGVDLHRKRSHVVALDPTGEVVLSRRIGNAPAEFWRIFGELEPEPIEVVFEATYGWSWFADLLADAGIAAHMAHPLATKAISAARVKNDAVDAKTLAHLLRTNLLAEAWIAPPDAREARRLVRTRAGLVRMRSRIQSQLHALLADLGVIPELTTLFGPTGRRWLADLGMPVSARARLDAGLRLIDAITVEITHADADLRASFAGDHRVRRLLPIPGIGLVTAATVVAEVWEIGRFPSPERLCSWAGLTPGERSSDIQTRRGHITKQGSHWLRWMLVEAATSAVRDPQLGQFAQQIAQRRGPKIARVALARRLLTLCYYALRDDGGCRAYPAPSTS